MKRFIEIENLTAGQARPYADSVLRERITFRCSFRTNEQVEISDLNEDLVKKFCRGWYHWEEKPVWPQSRLDYLKKISPGVWEIQITTPSTD